MIFQEFLKKTNNNFDSLKARKSMYMCKKNRRYKGTPTKI